MKDYGWFKLIIMAMGLLFVITAIPHVVSYGTALVQIFTDTSPYASTAQTWPYSIGGAAYVAQGVLGLYMLLGGGGIVRFCLRKLKDRCAVCDYRLVEVKGDRCPECGTPFVRDDAATRVVAGSSDAGSL